MLSGSSRPRCDGTPAPATPSPRRFARARRRGAERSSVRLPVMLSSFWVASTKPGAALARGQGWLPWQGRGWFLAPRDRGPEAGKYCWKAHLIDERPSRQREEHVLERAAADEDALRREPALVDGVRDRVAVVRAD